MMRRVILVNDRMDSRGVWSVGGAREQTGVVAVHDQFRCGLTQEESLVVGEPPRGSCGIGPACRVAGFSVVAVVGPGWDSTPPARAEKTLWQWRDPVFGVPPGWGRVPPAMAGESSL